jgi:hypothetical protein
MGKKWVELEWINGFLNGWVKNLDGEKRGRRTSMRASSLSKGYQTRSHVILSKRDEERI